jgi:Plavaka transposase
MLKEAALCEQKVLNGTTQASTNALRAPQIVLPMAFPDNLEELHDTDFPMNDLANHMGDYEDGGFYNPEFDEDDLPGYETTYTKSQRVEVCLLKLCTEMETPLYAFEEIMKWARQAFIDGYDFRPIQTTYRTQVDKLETWMGMENQRPEEKSVELPGVEGKVDHINVTRFDFTTQLKSLLDDPVLNRDENLVINTVDRFQKYSPPDGRLGECISGSWYKHAWEEMEKDGICDFMIPIILYIDKTQISISGKLSIFPVQMSLGIFTEKASLQWY